jgi:hypothetical protein
VSEKSSQSVSGGLRSDRAAGIEVVTSTIGRGIPNCKPAQTVPNRDSKLTRSAVSSDLRSGRTVRTETYVRSSWIRSRVLRAGRCLGGHDHGPVVPALSSRFGFVDIRFANRSKQQQSAIRPLDIVAAANRQLMIGRTRRHLTRRIPGPFQMDPRAMRNLMSADTRQQLPKPDHHPEPITWCGGGSASA